MKIQIFNILPVGDLKKHIETGDCGCKPDIEILEDRVLIKHNSFGGREVVEETKGMNKLLGTIEPNYKKTLSKDALAFIIGAIEKYGDKKSILIL